MKRRLWLNLGLGAAIVLVLVTIVGVLRAPSESDQAQRTVTVAEATVVATASASGEVIAPGVVTLSFATPGLVTAIEVTAGQQVRAGEVLATIDSTVARQQLAAAQQQLAAAASTASNASSSLDLAEQAAKASNEALDLAVEQAKANLTVAQSSWSEACINPNDPTCPHASAAEAVRQAQAAVQTAQIGLDAAIATSVGNETTFNLQVNQAQAALTQATNYSVTQCAVYGDSSLNCKSAQDAMFTRQQAYDTALNTRTQGLQRDKQTVQQADQSLVTARNAQRKVIADLRKANSDAVRQAGQALASAKSARDRGRIANAQAVQQARAALTSTGDTPSTSQATLDAAQAGLASAQRAVDQTELIAPVAGKVGSIDLVVGQTSAGSVTAIGGITLVPDGAFQVEATFAESDAADIEVGQSASVSFEGLAGRTATGTVVSVDPVGATSPTSGLVTFPVRVSLDDPPAGLRQGMTATVAVTTRSIDAAIAVPQAALTTEGDSVSVEVLQPDGTTKRVTVTVGVQGDTLTEITGGVEVGDDLVIPTASTTGFPAGGVPGGPMGRSRSTG